MHIFRIYLILKATWISLTSINLCELVGLEKLTNAFGILTMLRGIAIIGGVPLVGEIYEKFKLDITITYYIGGASLLISAAAVMLLFLPCLKRERNLVSLYLDIDRGKYMFFLHIVLCYLTI